MLSTWEKIPVWPEVQAFARIKNKKENNWQAAWSNQRIYGDLQIEWEDKFQRKVQRQEGLEARLEVHDCNLVSL